MQNIHNYDQGLPMRSSKQFFCQSTPETQRHCYLVCLIFLESIFGLIMTIDVMWTHELILIEMGEFGSCPAWEGRIHDNPTSDGQK